MEVEPGFIAAKKLRFIKMRRKVQKGLWMLEFLPIRRIWSLGLLSNEIGKKRFV